LPDVFSILNAVEFLPDTGSSALMSDSSGTTKGSTGSLGAIGLAGELVMTGAAASILPVNTIGLHIILLPASGFISIIP
jgi:hypothetical protein|tara:strand:- start:1441 stop:1677 length:237 start_codon:yes stop_codon:yes gene_type:complete